MELNFSIHSIQITDIYSFCDMYTRRALIRGHAICRSDPTVQEQDRPMRDNSLCTRKAQKRFHFNEARQASTRVHSVFSPQSPGKLLPTRKWFNRERYCVDPFITVRPHRTHANINRKAFRYFTILHILPHKLTTAWSNALSQRRTSRNVSQTWQAVENKIQKLTIATPRRRILVVKLKSQNSFIGPTLSNLLTGYGIEKWCLQTIVINSIYPVADQCADLED